MLSRRYLRIKVMQALYAYFHSDDKNAAKSEKDMFVSVEKIYDLYIYLLLFLVEIREASRELIAIRKAKHLPTSEDLNPNTRFTDNVIFSALSVNRMLAEQSKKRSISWDKEKDLIRKIFEKIREGEEYTQYMAAPGRSHAADREFVEEIYRNHIAEDELVLHLFEEMNIHWADDIDFVNSMLLKTIESVPEKATDNFRIMGLYKDEKEDKAFARDLFRKVIAHSEETDKIISAKTENWELERIAFMDVLIMKMAICELLYFPTIPVKVTLNEYIELAKQYSTPKSSLFVNGILDKLVAEFRDSGRLKKEGRGLVEG